MGLLWLILGGPARIPIFPIFPTPWEFVNFLRFPTDMITAKLTVNGGTYVLRGFFHLLLARYKP